MLPTSLYMRLLWQRPVWRAWSPGIARLLIWLLSTLLALTPLAYGGTSAPQEDLQTNELVLEVRLDGHLLSDSFTAYQDGQQFLIPIGELARLLTLGVTVNAQQGLASGFVVREDRSFALRVHDAMVSIGDRTASFEPRLVRMMGDDIVVSTQLLSRWLPLDMEIDLPTLQLRIKPRVRLPLQERLAREKMGDKLRRVGADGDGQGFELTQAPLKMLSSPFIDQTLGGDARLGEQSSQYKAAYTAYVTGDLLGMEGSAYVTSTRDHPLPEVRLSLARHDPAGQLLGALQARSVMLGHVPAPSVAHVMVSSPTGYGVLLSNRLLNQPTSFDRHSLRGDLPPGWDVTLYYNDALVAYQGAAVEGQYAFDDLPLAYGANEFRLVFNGPLGQVRVERQSFLLDQSTTKPGQWFYSLAHQVSGQGEARSVAQVDVGVTPSLALNAAVVKRPARSGMAGQYLQLGGRLYAAGSIGSAQIYSSGQGWLIEGSVKSRLAGYALEFTHVQRQRTFVSDLYTSSEIGLRYRDVLRVNGGLSVAWLPAITLALEAKRDVLWSGEVEASISGRASSMVAGTSISNSLRWQRSAVYAGTDGSLQVSRRVLNVGLSAQMDYGIRPVAALQAFTLTADRMLSSGFRLNAGVVHLPSSDQTLLSGGVSKNLGAFSVAVSGSYSSDREAVLGMQMFVALGKDPRKDRWWADAQPVAGGGAVSARVFLDRNNNGVRDDSEVLLSGAGFVINRGGRHPVRTDNQGSALMARLPAGQYVDVALDDGTLEDPQWKSRVPGWRVLARPGHVDMLEFPVVPSSEIEGTVYLMHKGQRRGVGDARLELLDEQQQVVARTTSSSDGYYLMHQVPPGQMTLRIAPDQAAKLKLSGAMTRQLLVPPEGDFLSGQDFELTK
jgi:hypothetical protein